MTGALVASCAAALASCAPVVTVDRDERVNVDPPTRLDVRNLTRGECDHAGGRWVILVRGETVCVDVDY